MTTLTNYRTPSWLPARTAGLLTCGHSIEVGEVITFLPAGRRTECNACSHARAKRIAKLREADWKGPDMGR